MLFNTLTPTTFFVLNSFHPHKREKKKEEKRKKEERRKSSVNMVSS
jgi:hypothetical protein